MLLSRKHLCQMSATTLGWSLHSPGLRPPLKKQPATWFSSSSTHTTTSGGSATATSWPVAVHGYSGRLRWQPCPGHIERNFWTTAAISPKKPYTQSANDYSTQEKMHQGDSESIPHGPTLASCDTPRWKSKSRHSWGLEWQTQMLGLLPVVKVPKKPIKCFTMFSCDCSCLFSWISLTEGEAGVSQCNQKVNNIMFGN